MRKKLLQIAAGVMALMMVVTSFSGAVPVYANDKQTKETTQAAKQEKVMTVTQDMVGKNGKLRISGEWDKIILPKEIIATHISFESVKAGSVQIESGTQSKIEMVSGEIGVLEVVPPKTTEVSVRELAELIRNSEDSNAVVREYQALTKKNEEYKNNRPILFTRKSVKVSQVSVSGNVKLNLNGGNVGHVNVDVGKADAILRVEIANYTGNVTVKQEDREDGGRAIANMVLKNTTVEKLELEGEHKGSITIAGQNSEVKEANIESISTVTLNVKTENLEVGENAKDIKVTVLAKVEEMKVEADNAKIEVVNGGNVTNATVEGNDVNISGNGKLEDVKIEGTGASVSTSGTKVDGENTYVPPVVVPSTPSTPSEPSVPSEPSTPSEPAEVRDLGGLHIIIGDHLSTDEPRQPVTEEEKALQKYREEMMEKHNFVIEQKQVGGWGEIESLFEEGTESGDPLAQVFLLDYQFLAGKRHLFYDLSTLSELDFSEDKWNDSVREWMTFDDGIYGMSAERSSAGEGILFNKRLFEAAGLDPELPYELQKNGEWTWSKFEEICAALTRDTNGDGVTDVYATVSQGTAMLEQLVTSNGTELITYENGKYVNNIGSEKVLEALNYAQSLVDAGYELPQTYESSWDYFQTDFKNGKAAMQFADERLTAPGQVYAMMEDEIGFVSCPKPDGAESYHTSFKDVVAVIPACYDEKTAADIAYAYNLWTNPAPGYEDNADAWKEVYQEYNLDSRAVDETLEILYQEGVGSGRSYYLVENAANSVGKDLYWQFPFSGDRTPEMLMEQMRPTWDAFVAEANEENTLDVVAPRPESSAGNFWVKEKEDGTLKIVGSRDKTMSELVVPAELNSKKVTEIASGAFSDCSELVSVIVSEGITTIGNSAFGSTKLETVTVPESVVSLTKYSFGRSENLVIIVHEGSYADEFAKNNGILAKYPDGTDVELVHKFFYEETTDGTLRITGIENPNVTKIVVPATIDGKAVTEIGSMAFFRSTVKEVVLPEGLRVIQSNAFGWCENLTSITLPESVTELWGSAFCVTGLTKLTIPKNVKRIDSDITWSTVSFREFEVAEENPYFTAVDGVLYSKDMKKLITVPHGIMTARYEVCDGTEFIQSGAFEECVNLESVVIPPSVKYIAEDAFRMSKKLSSIEVNENNPVFGSKDGVLYNKDLTELLCVPGGKEGKSFIVPDGVEKIGPCAFYSYQTMEEVILPEGLTEIGASAFAFCNGLTKLQLPDSLEKIDIAAFTNCGKLAEVMIPSKVKEIGSDAFSKGYSLKKVTISEGVESIGQAAFNECSILTEVLIPATVTQFGANLFDASRMLVLTVTKGSAADDYAKQNAIPVKYTDASLPATELIYVETEDGTVAVTGVKTLESSCVVIPSEVAGKAVTAVSGGAFANCSNLVRVELPATITEVEEGAFANCQDLRVVLFNGDVHEIAEDAFVGCVNSDITLVGIYLMDKSSVAWFAYEYGFNLILWEK